MPVVRRVSLFSRDLLPEGEGRATFSIGLDYQDFPEEFAGLG